VLPSVAAPHQQWSAAGAGQEGLCAWLRVSDAAESFLVPLKVPLLVSLLQYKHMCGCARTVLLDVPLQISQPAAGVRPEDRCAWSNMHSVQVVCHTCAQCIVCSQCICIAGGALQQYSPAARHQSGLALHPQLVGPLADSSARQPISWGCKARRLLCLDAGKSR
jgi:hypothetical protein